MMIEVQSRETGGEKLKAKETICRATISCLIEFGYTETSINRVAERANLSKGALQHHFPTKEELIAAVVETLLTRPLARPTSRDKGPAPPARLRSGWTDFVNTGYYIGPFWK